MYKNSKSILDIISNSTKVHSEIQKKYTEYAENYYLRRDRKSHRPCSERFNESDCLTDNPNCEWSRFRLWGNCRPKDDTEFTGAYNHTLSLLMGKIEKGKILRFPFISLAYDIMRSENWIQPTSESWARFYVTQILASEEGRSPDATSRLSDDITIFLMIYHTREVTRWAKLCKNDTLFKSPKEIMEIFLAVDSSSIFAKIIQFDCLSMLLQQTIKLGNKRVTASVSSRCNPIRKPLSSLMLGFLAILAFASVPADASSAVSAASQQQQSSQYLIHPFSSTEVVHEKICEYGKGSNHAVNAIISESFGSKYMSTSILYERIISVSLGHRKPNDEKGCQFEINFLEKAFVEIVAHIDYEKNFDKGSPLSIGDREDYTRLVFEFVGMYSFLHMQDAGRINKMVTESENTWISLIGGRAFHLSREYVYTKEEQTKILHIIDSVIHAVIENKNRIKDFRGPLMTDKLASRVIKLLNWINQSTILMLYVPMVLNAVMYASYIRKPQEQRVPSTSGILEFLRQNSAPGDLR